MKNKLSPSDRLEFLKNEKRYLESKIKKITNPKHKYPDKEQNTWFLKVFNDNLQKVTNELSTFNDK